MNIPIDLTFQDINLGNFCIEHTISFYEKIVDESMSQGLREDAARQLVILKQTNEKFIKAIDTYLKS